MEIVLSIINNVIMARVLGPANFGVYTLFLKICNIAGLLARVGTNDVIVKHVGITSGVGDWSKLKGYIRTAFQIMSIGSIVTVILISMIRQSLATNLFALPCLYKVLIFSVLVIPLQNCLLLIREIFRGLHDLKTASFLPAGQQLIFLGLLVIIILLGMLNVQNIIIALSVGIFCTLLVALFRLRGRLLNWHVKPERIKIPGLLQESVPMMVTRGSLLFMSSTDIYVLGIYASPAEVGIYGVVNALAAITVFSFDIVNQVIPAMIARYSAQKDFKTLSYVIRYASTLGVLFALPVLILVTCFGKFILTNIFGTQYAGGIIALYIILAGRLFTSFSGSTGYLLQMTGFHIILTRISVFCGLLNLLLNIALVQQFGKEGAAGATTISLVLQSFIVLVMAYRKTGIWALASIDIGKDIVNQVWSYLRTATGRLKNN